MGKKPGVQGSIENRHKISLPEADSSHFVFNLRASDILHKIVYEQYVDHVTLYNFISMVGGSRSNTWIIIGKKSGVGGVV
jgi:hypothetical protein